MSDAFTDYAPGLESPATSAFLIQPSDDADLPEVTRAVHVNQSGTVTVLFADGAESVTLTLERGAAYPYRLRRVLASGTTATVVGLV